MSVSVRQLIAAAAVAGGTCGTVGEGEGEAVVQTGSGIWCVGVCLGGGKHVFRIFDDFTAAQEHATKLKYDAVNLKVALWEM